MNKTNTPRKTWTIGKMTFLLPFVASHDCIRDRTGTLVGECRSADVAEDMVKLMNAIAQAPRVN